MNELVTLKKTTKKEIARQKELARAEALRLGNVHWQICLDDVKLKEHGLGADRWMDTLSDAIGWQNWRIDRRERGDIYVNIASVDNWIIVKLQIGHCFGGNMRGGEKKKIYEPFRAPEKRPLSYEDRAQKTWYVALSLRNLIWQSTTSNGLRSEEILEFVDSFFSQRMEGDYSYEIADGSFFDGKNRIVDSQVWKVRSNYFKDRNKTSRANLFFKKHQFNFKRVYPSK